MVCSSPVHLANIYCLKKELQYLMSTSVTANSGLMSVDASSTVKPKRYHPALVTLHWLIAILIFGTAFLALSGNEGGREGFRPGQGFPQGNFPQGGFQSDNPPQQGFQPGNPPQGGFRPPEGSASPFSTIGIHMILGITILVLLVIRLIVRWRTKHPDWASAGNALFDWIGGLTHFALYLFTFVMVITGIILASQRGQLARVFGIGTVAAGGFRRGGFSLGMFHGLTWSLLILLILLHVGAALYHQFILKDNLLGRMWFGKRTA